jgi:hypothetical protein
VGLGGERLINYFLRILYQETKCWPFGLGAKSLLTGVDFYTVTSRYNGREYSFMCTKTTVSAIAKFEDDIVNEVEIFFEGLDNEYSVYYRKTEKLNGVIIETEVKRHRRMDFISSIENQLGFIPNIELLIADGNMEYVSPNKRNIAVNAVLKRQIVSWRVRLLRRTSNSIEARGRLKYHDLVWNH